MSRAVFGSSGLLFVVLCVCTARPAAAQQEVYHPGETYDSLQAGRDAYFDAEAERRALIGRQIMLEEQIQATNTWSDPQDKYRPVRPESYGPIRPQVYTGPTLTDVYAYGSSGVVYYNNRFAGPPAGATNAYAAPVPAFESWPRVPGDIWGTPYYGYVRQPIGHVKIWTSRLGYIYKPVYASPAMEPEPQVAAPPAVVRRERVTSPLPSRRIPTSPGVVPPPPKPSIIAPPPVEKAPAGGEGQDL